jgi:hypothetical protein
MLRRALASARQILSHPRPLVPICLVFFGANVLAMWARLHGKQSAIVALVGLLLSVIRTWAALGVQNVALGLGRREPNSDAAFRAWISPGVLLQVALVGLVVFVGLVVAALVGLAAIKIGPFGYPIVAALGIAAVYVLIAISQYPLLLLDERADMTDSVMLSTDLTKGHRGTLLVAQLIPVGFLLATVGALALSGLSTTGEAPLSFVLVFAPIATVISVFWAALNAGLFLELLADLDRRLAEPDAALA